MWKRAEDVPKEAVDSILERYDQTEPALQRQIVVQAFLDRMRLEEANADMLRFCRTAEQAVSRVMDGDYAPHSAIIVLGEARLALLRAIEGASK